MGFNSPALRRFFAVPLGVVVADVVLGGVELEAGVPDDDGGAPA
jgi:hypothetical protein